MGYTAGRVWIEMLRIDTANHILGLRLNMWTSIIVFAGGLVYFLLHPGAAGDGRSSRAWSRQRRPAGAAGIPPDETDEKATRRRRR